MKSIMEYAWISLFGVGLTDLYVRLLAMGVISDPRLFLMAEAKYETHEYDVVVIGAGGAGLARRDRGLGAAARKPRSSASRCSARRTR